MEVRNNFEVLITPEAERYFIDLLDYLEQTHSASSIIKKSEEMLSLAESLSENPFIGKVEEILMHLGKGHKFIIYPLVKRGTIKIIYFIDFSTKTVYITDFFPSQMSPSKIESRQD